MTEPVPRMTPEERAWEAAGLTQPKVPLINETPEYDRVHGSVKTQFQGGMKPAFVGNVIENNNVDTVQRDFDLENKEKIESADFPVWDFGLED